MSDSPFDQTRERMVASLFGELSDAEREELEQALERDQNLRRELEELQQGRAFVQQATANHQQEAFAFTFPEETGATPAPSGGTVVQLWRRALAPAAGFAAAAMLFSALLVAGLRVDRTSRGLLVSFAGTDAPPATLAAGTAGQSGIAGARIGPERYLTRAEFEDMAEGLLELTAFRLDQLEQRQASTQNATARALYEALAVSQQRQYEDLSARLETAVFYAGLQPRGASLYLESESTPRSKEEQRHDYD